MTIWGGLVTNLCKFQILQNIGKIMSDMKIVTVLSIGQNGIWYKLNFVFIKIKWKWISVWNIFYSLALFPVSQTRWIGFLPLLSLTPGLGGKGLTMYWLSCFSTSAPCSVCFKLGLSNSVVALSEKFSPTQSSHKTILKISLSPCPFGQQHCDRFPNKYPFL